MKILILGAGITGLSIGKLLHEEHDVTILEKDSQIGGIAKTKQVENVTYHTVGGHCFNSKYIDVLSFVFDILDKKQWHKITRKSTVNLGSYNIDYPIEYSVRQIYDYDPDLAFEITKDFLSAQDDNRYLNLEEWFRKKFGNKLSDLYFIPYNTKIWGRPPMQMSSQWVQDKLPFPNKKVFFESLMERRVDTMPHAQFYYPNSNDQQTFINALSSRLNVICNESVREIRHCGDKWLVNAQYEADLVISTIPLNILPFCLVDAPQFVLDCARQLKYNKVSNVLWESRPTKDTWTYQPSNDSIFHRYIHIGNYYLPNRNYTITECIGAKSYEEMVEQGARDPFLIRPLDYHVSDHAYVVFDENRDKAVGAILDYLKSIGLISIGRFGQWEYFNMDVCIKQSIDTYHKIKNQQ